MLDIRLMRHLLDAVTAMEGKGPSHGTPRHLGWILAGKNALAIDAVAAWMMGYQDPFSIPLLRVARKRGIGPGSLEAIHLQGASWEQIRCPGFKRAPGNIRWIPTFLRGAVHGLVRVKPLLQRERCVRCGICATVCPVNAIELREGYPVIDSNRCVSCLCCHEMCPPGAMTAKENFLARIAIRNRA
jgi:NAD-dependent dihydropyrimidine dehydrogenase PreA subunit